MGRARRAVAPVVLGVAGSLVLSACSGYSGTPAHQVGQWASNAQVVSANSQLVQDVTELRRSASAHSLKKLVTNCAGLSYDAGTAYDFLPTPDRTLTYQLNTAYVSFVNGGAACAAASDVTSPRVEHALHQISGGLAALEDASKRLAAEGVR